MWVKGKGVLVEDAFLFLVKTDGETSIFRCLEAKYWHVYVASEFAHTSTAYSRCAQRDIGESPEDAGAVKRNNISTNVEPWYFLLTWHMNWVITR